MRFLATLFVIPTVYTISADVGKLRGRDEKVEIIDSALGEDRSFGRRDDKTDDSYTTVEVSEGEITDDDREVDECGDCQLLENCFQTRFSWFCRCEDGYERDETGCQDIDECLDSETNECSHSCENTSGSFECNCPEGYKLNDDGKTCDDIDECMLGWCPSPCLNYPGGYICGCETGFGSADRGEGLEKLEEYAEIIFGSAVVETSMNVPLPENFADLARQAAKSRGLVCEDIDECDEVVGICPKHSVCHNEVGTFQCECEDGYHVEHENNRRLEHSHSDDDNHSHGDDDNHSDGDDDHHQTGIDGFHGAISNEATWFMYWMLPLAQRKMGEVLLVLKDAFVYKQSPEVCEDINECEFGSPEGEDPCEKRAPCCANLEGNFECFEKVDRRGGCADGTSMWSS